MAALPAIFPSESRVSPPHVLPAIPTPFRASTISTMLATLPLGEVSDSVSVPRLLLELPSRPRVFFSNLRDLVFPRRFLPLEFRSTPAPFWPDVFVKRPLPWYGFLQSIASHALAFVLLIGFTRFLALQPQVVPTPVFDRAQVIYYQPSEYLPPLDTRSDTATEPTEADPEFSPQPIISVPPEADNRSQTIVTPPNIKLKHDVALPNIVPWADTPEKPRLEIPPVPLTPAADITRIAPQLQNSVVKPPPDAADFTHRRNLPTAQKAGAAPPPDVSASNPAAFQTSQPALIAPPPNVENASARPVGDLNIGPSSVIAPAPRLPVAEQHAAPGSRLTGMAVGTPQVVAPPPSLSASGSSAGFGARGRVIALNLHPAVGAPPDPPAGNRRGTFAATPEGHSGASGSPGPNSANTTGGAGSGGRGKETGTGSIRKGTTDVPAGLYVGSTTAKSSPVAGNQSSTNSVNPNLMASVRPPRVSSAPSRTMQPESTTKLSESERAVFGNRKFYSVTLNMPNLNSAGGSWGIRFAELNQDSRNHDANSPPPTATRKVDPGYPIQLMRENVSGTVILYAVIHADGSVGDVRVLRGVDDRLDRFASQAVSQWQFQPATKNGT